jgi:hypothetical protein
LAKKSEVVEILAGLKSSYHPTPEISADTWRIYTELLADEFDSGTLAAGAKLVAKTSKWWPSISELRAACLEVAGERAKLPLVGEAWAEARRAAAKFDTYAPPTGKDFSHPIVHRAALQAAGGWRRWCLSEDEAALRARFFEVFRDLREREFTQRALPVSQRHLSAEESRQLLEDLAGRPQLTSENSRGAEERTRRELLSLVKRRGAPIVGEALTDAEWEARKAQALGRLDA